MCLPIIDARREPSTSFQLCLKSSVVHHPRHNTPSAGWLHRIALQQAKHCNAALKQDSFDKPLASI